MPKQRPIRAGEIADGIRREFIAKLPPTYKLPAERDLADYFDTSRETVRRALQLLVEDGLIESYGHRQGYRIRDVRMRSVLMTKPALLPDQTELAERLPIELSALDVTKAIPEPRIAELLGLQHNESVAIHRQQYLVKERPTGSSTAYIPSKVLLAAPRLAEVKVVDFVETLREAGYQIASIVDKTGARRPTEEECEAWGIPEGLPIVQHRRVVRAQQGEVLFIAITSLTADRYQFEHSLSENDIVSVQPTQAD